MAEPSRPLHVISWNCAAWGTTIKEISKRHGTERSATQPAVRGLDAWLRDLAVDVLCLQEVKLTKDEIYNAPDAVGAAPQGFESFWATNEGEYAQSKGLNGVGAYVRDGLAVRVERTPLGVADLDGEGRCILIELVGGVVIVNVYVPNGSGGRLGIKLRFLDALAALVRAEHGAGRAVVVVGDLNLQARAVDTHWRCRRLDLGALAAAHAAATLDAAALGLPPLTEHEEPSERAAAARALLDSRALALARALGAGYRELSAALEGSEVRPIETLNTKTGARFAKHKLWVPCPPPAGAPADAKPIWRAVGAPCDSANDARWGFELGGAVASVGDADKGAALDGERVELRRPGEMSVECSRCLADAVLGGLEGCDDAWARLAESTTLCRGSTAPVLLQRFAALLHAGGGLVDTFAAAHPHAADRFTCWNQYTNKRFENVGARIDYILAPRHMCWRSPTEADGHAAAVGALDTGGTPHPSDSAAAALAAATAGGRWRGADFGGGGLMDGRREDYWLHAQRAPHTGIIYTPPQYSDHVGVSALLAFDFGAPRPAERRIEAGAQPHLRKLKERSFMNSWAKSAAATAAPALEPAPSPTPGAGPASDPGALPALPMPHNPEAGATSGGATAKGKLPSGKPSAKAKGGDKQATKGEPAAKRAKPGPMDAFLVRR